LRAGQSHPIDLEIVRAEVKVLDVSWQLLPDMPIAHIAIQDFGAQADAQLKSAIGEAQKQGARALIVDVRLNPGGLKEKAVAVTSEFIASGVVFIEQDAQGNRKPVEARGDPSAPDIPICVLIDEGTASSAEIFAGAVQDHKRGTLVGMRTFGTGTVLQPF